MRNPSQEKASDEQGPEADAPSIRITEWPPSITDSALVERAVKAARHGRKKDGEKHSRWLAVMDVFLLNRTCSVILCKRYGLDPNEQVER